MSVEPLVISLNSDALAPADRILDFVARLQQSLPRGKGSVPRWLGKHLVKPLTRSLSTRHNMHLVLSPSSFDVYATMRLHGNAWDYHDFEICRAGLPDGGVFYEIGANVGYYALEQAGLDRTGTVVAFEPQRDLAEAIAASASANDLDNLTIFNVLVGDHCGDATLYLAPGSIHASAVADSGRPVIGHISMPMVTIDALVSAGKIDEPDMVKMDVEGSESLVFQGGAETFRRAQPHIYLEYLPDCDPDGRIKGEIIRLMTDVPHYRLYASPDKAPDNLRQERLFVIEAGTPWVGIDGLYLRNSQRAVRHEEFFG